MCRRSRVCAVRRMVHPYVASSGRSAAGQVGGNQLGKFNIRINSGPPGLHPDPDDQNTSPTTWSPAPLGGRPGTSEDRDVHRVSSPVTSRRSPPAPVRGRRRTGHRRPAQDLFYGLTFSASVRVGPPTRRCERDFCAPSPVEVPIIQRVIFDDLPRATSRHRCRQPADASPPY